MVGITYGQMLLFITAAWIVYRVIAALAAGRVSAVRELRMLLVYICLIVVARFVYFPLRHVNGRIDILRLGSNGNGKLWVNLVPFVNLFKAYDGWLINIIGNIAMFIPVGFVWPLCFKKLNTVGKATLAGAGLSLMIELSQLLFYERNTDTDDLILNTLGAAIGAALYFALRRRARRNRPRGRRNE